MRLSVGAGDAKDGLIASFCSLPVGVDSVSMVSRLCLEVTFKKGQLERLCMLFDDI